MTQVAIRLATALAVSAMVAPAWAQDVLRISAPEALEVAAGAGVTLDIALPEGAAPPPRSFVRISGLPSAAKLSQGYRISDTTWAVPLQALSKLELSVTSALTTATRLEVALMSLDGSRLARTSIELIPTGAGTPTETSPAVRVLRTTPAAPAPPQAASEPLPAIATKRAEALPPVSLPAPPAAAPPQTAALPPATASEPQRAAPSAATPVGEPTREPAMSAEVRERAERFVTRGDLLMRDGNVAGARLFYERAAKLGLSAGALALAQTFDPAQMARLGVVGLQPDRDRAMKWYDEAKRLRDRDPRAAGN